MSRERRQPTRSVTWRRVLRVVLLSMAWSPYPYFTPRTLPLLDDGPEPLAGGPEPAGSRAPRCTLSRAERRAWAEIEARYE